MERTDGWLDESVDWKVLEGSEGMLLFCLFSARERPVKSQRRGEGGQTFVSYTFICMMCFSTFFSVYVHEKSSLQRMVGCIGDYQVSFVRPAVQGRYARITHTAPY